MATAKKHGKQYRVIAYLGMVDGKKQYKSFSAPTKAEAERKAAEYKQKHKSTKALTDTFVEYAMASNNAKTNILSPSTIRKYNTMVRTLDQKYKWFASKPIGKITEHDVQVLVNELSAVNAPKTVRSYYGYINSFLSFEGINLPRIEAKSVDIPTKEEVERIKSITKNTCMYIPVLLASECMMRRGEICALAMSDINFDNHTITINKNMVMDANSKWIIKAPKTVYSTRTIKAPEYILDLIRQQGYVTKCNPNKITGYFAKYCERAKVPPYRFHALRHYCASVFHYLNIPMGYTQEYGGWGKDGETLQKIYQHTLRDESDDVYGKAIDYFSKG